MKDIEDHNISLRFITNVQNGPPYLISYSLHDLTWNRKVMFVFDNKFYKYWVKLNLKVAPKRKVCLKIYLYIIKIVLKKCETLNM